MVATANKSSSGKGLRIASGCSTLDEFTAVFRKFCTPKSIFFATKSPRPINDEIKFAVSLKDGKTVMRGTGKVASSFTGADNEYKRPGMVIEFKVLDTMGKILLAELNASSSKVKPLPSSDGGFEVPTLIHQEDDDEETKNAPDRSLLDHSDDGEEVTRVSPDSMDDGFDPLMEEYVECTLVEEEAQEVDDEDEDEDEDEDDERTSIGPMPTNPAFATTQVASPSQVQQSKSQAPAKLPGMPSPLRSDPTEPGLGPEAEESTVLAPAASGGVPSPIAPPRQAPPSAGAVPTPVPPTGPQFSGELPPPGQPVLPPPGQPVLPPPGQPVLPPPGQPPINSTQMGMLPLPQLPGQIPVGQPLPPPQGAPPPGTPPPGQAPIGALPLGQLPLGQSSTPPPPAAGAPSQGAPAPEARFRVPSPPQGFRVPTPAEMASAVMEPLNAPGGQAPQPVPTPGAVPTPGEVPVASPPAALTTGEIPVHDGGFGGAPGRAPSIAAHSAGQSFPDFVAPTGPMPPQGGAAAPAPGVITKKLAGLVAVACLLVGAGIGFAIGQSSSSDSAAGVAETGTNPETPETGVDIDTVALGLDFDAGTEAVAVDKEDAAVALATSEDASVEVVVDAGPPDASEEVPATAATPELVDPGPPKEGECALTVAVTPEDAVISFNSIKLEKGVKKVNVPCGVFPMTITHPQYKNHKGRIVLKSSRVNTLELSLKAPAVMFQVVSVPSKALVSFGNEDVGRTPFKRLVPAHQPIELKLIRSGYKAYSATITPTAAKTLKIRLQKRRRGKRGKKRKKPTIKL